MPRQFAFRGDRLAYSWGIVLLAAIAFLLLWAFGGDTHALIPLYSVGVFLCFTLSQTGMVRHWWRTRETGWRWRLGVNATGAVLTGVVLGIVVFEKFADGAYLVVILVPLLVGDDAVHPSPVRRAPHANSRSGRTSSSRPPHREERVVVPIPGLTRAVIQAINVGRSIDDDVRAVYITDDLAAAAVVRETFERQVPGVPLVVVESPYRALAGAVARLPRRARHGLAAGPRGAHHVRGHPRVRGPQLVGADPLQPGRQAAAHRCCWAGRTRSWSTCRIGARIRRCSNRRSIRTSRPD